MKKRIFDGKLLKLRLERRRLPNGYRAYLEVIEHPGAVLIVPFLSKDRIVLIKQYRPVIDSYIWELPAGVLHKNESPLKCARRETVEEIGYAAKNWKKIGYIYPAPGYTTEKIAIYKAWKLSPVNYKNEADEIITPAILTAHEVGRMLRSGKIVDAKTVCALKMADVI